MQKRLTALDAFRGFTVAAMIMINFPGNDEFVFHTLRHSKWNVLSFTDHVAPFFLFIIGISIHFAYYNKTSNAKLTFYKKIIIWRALKILPCSKYSKIGVIFGVNAISAYVLGDLLALIFYNLKMEGSPLNMDFFNYFTSLGMIPELTSWIYALLFVSIVSIACWILYKKGIIVKV